MNLTDFLQLLRRSWVALVVGVLLGASAGYAYTAVKHPTYTASADVYVSTGSTDNISDANQATSYAQQAVKNVAAIATTGYVLRGVISDLDLPTTPAVLATHITTTADTDTTLVGIAVEYSSAKDAAAIANTVATRLATAVDKLTPSSASSTKIKITTLDAAIAPKAPSSPSLALDVLIGVVAGLGLALVLALLTERLRTRIRSVRDLRRVVDATVLGTLLKSSSSGIGVLTMRDRPHSPEAEAVRSLRANLAFLKFPQPSRAFVVTSSLDGEGKSTTAANLAIALADARQSVILVDGDLRRPSLADRMGLDGSIGLSDVLSEQASLDHAVQMMGGRAVAVLPAGSVPPNPSELLQSDDMRRLIIELRARYQYVIIDAPPVLAVADAVILADATDGAILVTEVGRTKAGQLHSAIDTLAAAETRLLGVVANRVPRTGVDAERTGRYGYGYGAAASAS